MSELDKNFQETIFNTLASLLAQNKFDTDTQLDIYLAMKKAAMDLQEGQIQKIKDKIDTWESMYGQADTSLYTLGLRHALDIITDVRWLLTITVSMTSLMKTVKSLN
jgi:hypothetical protein